MKRFPCHLSPGIARDAIVFLCLTAAVASADGIEGLGEGWNPLADGIEIGSFRATRESIVGDSRIVILRADPRAWEMVLAGPGLTQESASRTAREWAGDLDFVAVINAGMFAADYRTHVGFARAGDHINNEHINEYLSLAAFGDKRGSGTPPFRIFDLDEPDAKIDDMTKQYDSLVQNLRLIKRPGENRWKPQEKKWSEAALGEDAAGRILLIFCRSPYSMHDLNDELLALDVDLVAAQHLEGGPEAQLYVRYGDFEMELVGSYETGFNENDGNRTAWPIPNVLGIRARESMK